MPWGLKLFATVVMVVVVVAGGLAIYGSQVTPKRHIIEQTIPDARFSQ